MIRDPADHGSQAVNADREKDVFAQTYTGSLERRSRDQAYGNFYYNRVDVPARTNRGRFIICVCCSLKRGSLHYPFALNLA